MQHVSTEGARGPDREEEEREKRGEEEWDRKWNLKDEGERSIHIHSRTYSQARTGTGYYDNRGFLRY